jgi:hypothetical protein
MFGTTEEKPWKALVSLAVGLRAKAWTRELRDTKQECCGLSRNGRYVAQQCVPKSSLSIVAGLYFCMFSQMVIKQLQLR